MICLSKHLNLNTLAYLLAGAGLGILVTYPLAGVHPLRWAGVLLVLSLLVHLYPYFKKNHKK